MSKVIGCAITVHRELGPGFKERIYQEALRLEFSERGLRFESEKRVEVRFKQWSIPGQTIDLIVEDVVLVEVKAVSSLTDVHEAQVVSYLKTTGLKVGLLLNFNHVLLKQGLRRIVV